MQRPFGERWAYAGSGYFTLTQLSKSREDASARFLGLNARVGYYFPGLGDAWTLSLWGGAYYATMQVTTSDPDLIFGFKNQRGPQAFVVLKRTLGSKLFASGYLKLSPIMASVTDLSISDSSEKAAGLSMGWKLPSGNMVILGLDFAVLNLKIQEIALQSGSTSIGLGYSF